MKITLNKLISTNQDNRFIRKAILRKAEAENMLRELQKFKYKKFRQFLSSLNLRELAILVSFQDENLNQRVNLHLSNESKEQLNMFFENENNLSENEKSTFMILLRINFLLS